MPQLRPQFLTDVRSNRREHQNEGLNCNARHAIARRQVIVENDELCNRSIDAQILVLDGHFRNGACQEARGLRIHWLIADGHLTGGFVQDISPQTLQETLRANNCAGVPRTRDVKRSHAHLIHAENVGAVGVIHFIRGHDVLQ